MKHLFVPYELALKLKEKGFNECCFGQWYIAPKKNNEPILFTFVNPNTAALSEQHQCGAPLYQQVIDWFREKHTIDIQCQVNSNFLCDWDVINFKKGKILKRNKEDKQLPYYQALNKAIEEALKFIP